MKKKFFSLIQKIIVRIGFLFIGLFFSSILFFISMYYIDEDLYLHIAVMLKSPYLVSITPYENYELSNGILKTEYSNLPYQEFSVTKPDNVYRVFLFGGSQAMGEPYVHESLVSNSDIFKVVDVPEQGGLATWLQKYFQKIHSNKKVEVINSAIGGGSLSEAIFAWQEVCSYTKPDLCIFLSGNNECNSDIYLFLRLILKNFKFIKNEKKYNILIDYLSWFYKRKLDLIKKIVFQKKIKTYLLTVPNNIKDWKPFVSFGINDSKYLNENDINTPSDLSSLKKSLGDNSYDFPFIYHYLLGKKNYENKKYDKAWEQFTLAKDKSLGATRSHSNFNNLIKGFNDKYIKSIDLEMLIRKYAKNGIPGFDLFFDACHMKLRTNNFLAYEIAKKHAQLLNKSDIKLKLIDLKNFEVKRLRQLYKIKIKKWDTINRLKKFKALGKENKKEVKKQYMEALIELESVDMLISTIENQDKIKK